MTNKLHKFLVSVLVLAVAVTGLAGAGEWKMVKADDFSLEWMVDGANLNVKLSAPTEGWLAVGFNPTNKMKDANIIIGYVEDGQVVIEDHYGNSQISHKPDMEMGGMDNITNKAGSETGGVTAISFTIPLDSGDGNDRALVPGQSYKVIFASNNKDRISIKHNRRTSATIVL